MDTLSDQVFSLYSKYGAGNNLLMPISCQRSQGVLGSGHGACGRALRIVSTNLKSSTKWAGIPGQASHSSMSRSQSY